MPNSTYINARGQGLSTVSSVTSTSTIIWGAVAGVTTTAPGGGHTLYGDNGDDTFDIFSPTDQIVSPAQHGVYTISFSGWFDTYALQSGIQNLIVSGSNDIASGNALDNLIMTQSGPAIVSGGGGDDVFVLGTGADVVIDPKSSGSDVIYGFKHGTDHVRLDGTSFSSWADVQGALTQVGSDVQLNMSGGQTLTFRNDALSGFSASDFYEPINTAKLTMTFDDEFNSFVSSPDGSKGWMTSYPVMGINNRELPLNGEAEYYSDSSVGVNPYSVSNGVLDITASVAQPGSNPGGMPYTSGVMTTYQSLQQEYGYFEIRAELPTGAGLWPAFWLKSPDNSAELDIFEVLGISPTTLFATASDHTTGASVSQSLIVPDTSTAFHTYGVDWEPATVTFYMDGNVIATTPTPASLNKPMYMIIDLAVGASGSWPGAPTSNSIFPATMQVDYVRAYATAATINVSGSAVLPPVSPAPPPVPQPAPASPVTVVTGQTGPTTAVPVISPASGGLVISVSEDAWNGNAQFVVTVDGKQVGGTDTATVLHSSGLKQDVSIGPLAAGTHQVGISFINDAYGGTLSTDRNLYVAGATYNGQAIAGSASSLYSNGTSTFAVSVPAVSAPAAAAITSTAVINVSEDAYGGNAQFIVTVDGKQMGGTYTATALHNAGQSQPITVSGIAEHFVAHDIAITFLNDAYGGTSSTDRNLYVNSIKFDNQSVGGGTAALYSDGTKHFAAVAPSNWTG